MDILTFKTILVAEDDDFMRRVLVAVLTRLGGRVIETANGQEALKVLNDPIKVDIALLDILMPEVHGLYVLHAIRAGLTNQDFAMPVMLLTATRDEASVHYAAGLSCDGFLIKPINQADISDRLTKIIAKRMTLPYKPPHYRKIDVGPPDKPPSMPAARPTGLAMADIRIGMVFSAPVIGKGRELVPKGTRVTQELLNLLHHLEKVVVIEPMMAEVEDSAA
jgi:two-component system chemotaxis response regulator CheY